MFKLSHGRLFSSYATIANFTTSRSHTLQVTLHITSTNKFCNWPRSTGILFVLNFCLLIIIPQLLVVVVIRGKERAPLKLGFGTNELKAIFYSIFYDVKWRIKLISFKEPNEEESPAPRVLSLRVSVLRSTSVYLLYFPFLWARLRFHRNGKSCRLHEPREKIRAPNSIQKLCFDWIHTHSSKFLLQNVNLLA